MEASRNRRLCFFDLSTLGHPVWWAALALLIFNDWFLKGAGLAPGWLTGKLSDFAFLIVAPVLGGALLPAALPRRRMVAVVVVTGVFVAAKLSPAVSVALIALVARLGLTWRLWPDPTDLLALAVLPLTVRLMRERPPAAPAAPAWHLRERAGVVLGAAACLATSAPRGYQHQPFLLNAAPTPSTVTVTWVLRAVPCPSPEAPKQFPNGFLDASTATVPAALTELADTLTASDLDDPRALPLARGEVAALDGIPPPGASPVGVCATAISWSNDSVCFAAILESPPAAPVLMVAPGHWVEYDGGGFFSCQNPPSPVSRCAASLDPSKDPGSDAVTLKVVNGALAFRAGSKIELGPVDPVAIAARAASPTGCRSLRADYRALIAPSTCATNADCVGLRGIDIPGDPLACQVETNSGSAALLATVESAWSAGCVTGPQYCSTAHPAVCVAGSCVAACADVDLPICSPPCLAWEAEVGNSCGPGGTCLQRRRQELRLCRRRHQLRRAGSALDRLPPLLPLRSGRRLAGRRRRDCSAEPRRREPGRRAGRRRRRARRLSFVIATSSRAPRAARARRTGARRGGSSRRARPTGD